MIVKVYRNDPERDPAPYFQEFNVPTEMDWSVMDVLDYIAEHFDSTLAYYRHSACDHGICGRCALKVNGKTALACTRQIGEDPELILTPKSGKVIRDLVVSSGK